MMIPDEFSEEIVAYKRTTIKVSLVGLSLLLVSTAISRFSGAPVLYLFLCGSLLGATLAFINVLALGHACVGLMQRTSSRLIVLWPILSFMALSAGALITALLYPDLVIGFAFGLATPLAIGAFIVFLPARPA